MKPITIDQLIEKIHCWSTSHGLNQGDPYKQMIKITEEVGELAQGLLKGNDEQILDSIGDTIITLAILCQQRDIDITDALNHAYKQIEHRTGTMVDGTFIKQEDMVRTSNIFKVTSEQATRIIEERKPLGNFYSIEIDDVGTITYIAIDNTTGDAWVEEFTDHNEMISWLRRDKKWLEL